ncbi:MAG: glutamyl-tRNA reductase [Neisseriaceae bacterium]
MYSLGVFGVDYKSAGLDVRDKLAFTKEEISAVLCKLRNSGVVREAILLSTCNRMEVYCIAKEIDFVINIIGEFKNVCPYNVIKKHSYIYSDDECVVHLFRVISGLESMVLGETEIVAQVKEAYALSKENNFISKELSSIFQMALAAVKDVRNATQINNSGISMGNAIVNVVAERFTDLTNQKILFLGSGNMMQTIAPHFKSIECSSKTVISRTLVNADNLAKRINGKGIQLNQLPVVISDYSIIIACCYSQSPLLDNKLLEESIKTKKQILIIDLSVPMTTDFNLSNYPNVTVLTIDDIAKIVDVGLEKRRNLALAADVLIKDKVLEYQKWKRKKGLSPVIRALRDNAEALRLEVLSNAKQQILNGGLIDSVLNDLSIKLTNKLIHAPTVNLCAALDISEQDDLTNLLCHLYDLEIKVD